MKLSTARMTTVAALSFLASPTAAVAPAATATSASFRQAITSTTTINGSPSMRRLFQNARRLEQGDGGDNAAGVDDALMNYSLKLLKCHNDISLGTNDDGVTQYGVAIVRACPSNSCNSNTQGGCKNGHADFAVPLADFVAAYYMTEDDAAMQAWDDDARNNAVANYAQCAQSGDYYIGPSCTKDGKDIMLDVFTDAYCYEKANVNLKSISSGSELIFSQGGLVSAQCVSCGEDSDGDGNLNLKEMCSELYQDAALKCEEWDINHYYWDAITEVYRFGKDTTGCKRIGWMEKSPEPVSEWASIFALAFLVVGSIAGAVWYTTWWRQQKSKLEKIDDENADDEDGEYVQHEGGAVGEGDSHSNASSFKSNHSGLRGIFKDLKGIFA